MSAHRILVVASGFPPIHSGGVYRTLRLAKFLPALGWELHVLTLDLDHLPKGTNIDAKLLEQISDNTKIHRVRARFPIEKINRVLRRKNSTPTSTQPKQKTSTEQSSTGSTKSANLLQRIKDCVTLPWMTPDRLVGWVRPAAKKGKLISKQEEIEVVYSSGPPWSNHLVAMEIVRSTGLPWVADFRDPWVGNAFRQNRSGDSWVGRKHRELERSVFETAGQIIFNTARSREDAVSRIGKFLLEKSVVIPNGFDPDHFAISNEKAHCLEQQPESGGPLRITHTGSFYGKRNVDSLLEVVGRLKADESVSASDLQIELIGNTRDHEAQRIILHNLEDIVTTTPPIPHHQCLQRLFDADALLLVQTEAPLCVPGKVYEYIAVGKPVLTLAGDGATADLVRNENLGPCIDPDDQAGLRSALLRLVDEHRNGTLAGLLANTRDTYDGQKTNGVFRRYVSTRNGGWR